MQMRVALLLQRQKFFPSGIRGYELRIIPVDPPLSNLPFKPIPRHFIDCDYGDLAAACQSQLPSRFVYTEEQIVYGPVDGNRATGRMSAHTSENHFEVAVLQAEKFHLE